MLGMGLSSVVILCCIVISPRITSLPKKSRNSKNESRRSPWKITYPRPLHGMSLIPSRFSNQGGCCHPFHQATSQIGRLRSTRHFLRNKPLAPTRFPSSHRHPVSGSQSKIGKSIRINGGRQKGRRMTTRGSGAWRRTSWTGRATDGWAMRLAGGK